MKISIHVNAIDERGCGKTPYDYGLTLKKAGHEVCFITSEKSNNQGANKILKHFNIHFYPGKIAQDPDLIIKSQIEQIVDKQKIDFLHMIKSGEDDNVTPNNCKTGIHCVFNMSQAHGSVYAGVSNYLAKKFNKTLYVPHIIERKVPNKDIRKALNIPSDCLVVGRHGGKDTFNVPFVAETVISILNKRKDIYFLFLSTQPFVQHERVIFFPWVEQEIGITNFIEACDIMLHARFDGETFGLAVGEFNVQNKPVITWSGILNGNKYPYYDTAHIEHLQDKSILYNDNATLENILLNINKKDLSNTHWDVFSQNFSAERVLKQYQEVFLK